ncbi:hypothetical protein Poly24_33770 [Rosistilla carotiformis]|uniref:Uncharacterized protein n=1 Tax=Rosistilla carotiformis TaxID=2528017 RepID=A0A518JVU3_9BACT|nr:hypothetical protein Poly24_33770 [Rosistilla carotiformis]
MQSYTCCNFVCGFSAKAYIVLYYVRFFCSDGGKHRKCRTPLRLRSTHTFRSVARSVSTVRALFFGDLEKLGRTRFGGMYNSACERVMAFA